MTKSGVECVCEAVIISMNEVQVRVRQGVKPEK